jgi:PAS domain S-box-containing protein
MENPNSNASLSLSDPEMLVQVLDNAQVAIVIADKDTRVHRINNEFTNIFGYTPEEAVGRTISELILLENRPLEKSMKIRERVNKGERFEYETTRKRKDGTIIDVECRVSAIVKDGEMVGAYSFYTDITQRKNAQDQLKKAHEGLERKVEKRTRDLRSANKQLKEENRDRKQAQKDLTESEEKCK